MNPQPWSLENNRLTLYCHLQPGAKQNQLCGLYNDRLKIQIRAPAVDGKANKALIEYLSKAFNIAKSKILIHKGLNQRSKTVLIDGIEQLPGALQQLAPPPGN
jgi:uncharacterized protein